MNDEDFHPPLRRALLRAWRWLDGPADVPRAYVLTRFVIVRALGLVYFVAFCTAVLQIVPLLGSEGLLPVGLYLDRLRDHFGSTAAAAFNVPSVFWLDHGDATLLAVSVLGAVLAFLVMSGLTNAVALGLLWAAYMSIDHVGQRWYAFGWESQLLETGFLAMFLCPVRSWRPLPHTAPPRVVIWLFRWLTFRIMLGAGLIKLRGDPCWTDLTCLDFHFETQPVPNPLAGWLHHAPSFVHTTGVLVNHFVELVVPFGVFGPRRVRHVAGVCLVSFQLMLIVSGNLSFLNWLTIVPALACFDDGFWRRLIPRRFRERPGSRHPRAETPRSARIVAGALAVLVAWLSIDVVLNLIGRRQAMNRSYDRLHLVNTYGAFGSIGRDRFELVIEGTRDAPGPDARWQAYELPCKPGDPKRRPCLITPYHYRLDWLMWFAALEAARTGGLQREDWVIHLLAQLLDGDADIGRLLAQDPFVDAPPRAVRVLLYRYRLAPPDEDVWWERELIGELIRPVTRDDPDLVAYLRRRGW